MASSSGSTSQSASHQLRASLGNSAPAVLAISSGRNNRSCMPPLPRSPPLPPPPPAAQQQRLTYRTLRQHQPTAPASCTTSSSHPTPQPPPLPPLIPTHIHPTRTHTHTHTHPLHPPLTPTDPHTHPPGSWRRMRMWTRTWRSCSRTREATRT